MAKKKIAKKRAKKITPNLEFVPAVLNLENQIRDNKAARRTGFEMATSGRQRLEIMGGARAEMRPVHPSDVESEKIKFCEANGFDESEVAFTYDEVGMSLVATW